MNSYIYISLEHWAIVYIYSAMSVVNLPGRFQQIKPFLPIYARVKYCNAFILSHLEYCSTVWGCAQTTKLLVLQ